MPDYSEILDQRASEPTQTPTVAQLSAHLRGSRMVALKLDELLKSGTWDLYRSHLKPMLEADQEERQILRDRIERGELVGDELVRANFRLQRLSGRIEARQEDFDLPALLIARDETTQAIGHEVLDKAG